MTDGVQQSEVIILVKAAYQPHSNPSEMVYCAGVTPSGEWVRLAPVSFRSPVEAMRYKRWDRVRFRWQSDGQDARPETRHVVTHSMDIVGEVTMSKRREILQPLIATNLAVANTEGRTLAMVRPRDLKFAIRQKTPQEIGAEQMEYERIAGQINSDALKPQKPFPFKFHYQFKTDDGAFESTYQDWEMGETFSNLAESFGRPQAMARAMQVYGKEYPHKGVVFIMSRPHAFEKNWDIHAVICMDEVHDVLASNLDLTV